MVVMLDSGATHNFIDPFIIEKAQLTLFMNRRLEILLGAGLRANRTGVCKIVPFCLQTLDFVADFIVLELGKIDIILGVQWLRTLEKCVMDWEKHEVFFWYKNQMVTLYEDTSLHQVGSMLQTHQGTRSDCSVGFEDEIFQMNHHLTDMSIPVEVQHLLRSHRGVL